MTRLSSRAAVLGALFAACSGVLAQEMPGKAMKAITCAVEGLPTRLEAAGALSFRRTIEASPLYALPAASEGLVTCRVRHQANSVLVLEYRFRHGGTLTVTRNERIQYLEQEGRFDLPTDEAAEMLLVGAEHAAFGTKGCGIDWHQSHNRLAENDPGATETIYEGDVCNCQARIRRRADGNVSRLLFRSAC